MTEHKYADWEISTIKGKLEESAMNKAELRARGLDERGMSSNGKLHIATLEWMALDIIIQLEQQLEEKIAENTDLNESLKIIRKRDDMAIELPITLPPIMSDTPSKVPKRRRKDI